MRQITHSNTPMPASRRSPRFDWRGLFASIQQTGERRKLNGEFTNSQMVQITNMARYWSNRNGFGNITVKRRSERITKDGPRHRQYVYEIWVTVENPDRSNENFDETMKRLIDQIAGR